MNNGQYTTGNTYAMPGAMGPAQPVTVPMVPVAMVSKIVKAFMIMVGVGMIFVAGLTLGFVSGDHTPPSQVQTALSDAQDANPGRHCWAEWGTNGLWDVDCQSDAQVRQEHSKIVFGR